MGVLPTTARMSQICIVPSFGPPRDDAEETAPARASPACTTAPAAAFAAEIGNAEIEDGGRLAGPAGQSGLSPANLTTLPHFSVSSATYWTKPAGERANTVAPWSASCILSFGSARPAVTASLRIATISVGVFF